MPITYQFDLPAALIRTRCSGDVTLPEILNHFTTLAGDPNRPDRLNVFLDLRELTSSPTAEQIRQASDALGRLTGSLSFGICAIVAQRDALYGMSRMFGIFCEPFFSEINVFRTAAEADEWLRPERRAQVHGHGQSIIP